MKYRRQLPKDMRLMLEAHRDRQQMVYTVSGGAVVAFLILLTFFS